MADRTVSVNLIARVQGYVGGIATAAAATKEFGGELDKLSVKSKGKFDSIAKVGLGAGAALTAVAGFAVKAAADFDKTMSGVQATAGASADQLAKLRDAAIKTGQATAFSATDAAKAESELAKAGVSVKDILGGALTGTVALAAAGQLNLADAATDTATALNMFQLSGSSASHVADVLTAAANKSATDVGGMAQALNQTGEIAHQSNLSLEDTAGTLALFAQNGLSGSDAGTSFKTMLMALNPTSEQTKALMDKLGISFYDAQGNFIGITKVAGVLQDKLGGLSQQERTNALNTIFGSDAARAAGILYTQGSAGVQKWIDSVNDSGIASRTASMQMNNLSGDIEQLKGSLETLAISSSGGATKGLRLLTEGATSAVNAFISLPTPISGTLTVLSGVSGVALLAAAGFVKARGAGKDFLNTISEMGPSGEKAAVGLGKVGGVLSKATLWGAAAFAAYAGIKALFGYLDKQGQPAKHNIDALTESLAKFGQTGKITGELLKVTGPSLQDLAASVSGANELMSKLTSNQTLLQNFRAGQSIGQQRVGIDAAAADQAQQLQNLKDLDTSLKNLVANGDTTDAYKVFSSISQALQAQGWSLAQVNAKFPQYADAASRAAIANEVASGSTNKLVTSQGTLVTSMNDAISKGAQLKDVLDSLSGANESAERATIAANQATADLKKTLSEGTKTLNINTEAGRKHVSGILDTIDTYKQAFQSTYAQEVATKGQTGALNDATKQYDSYISRLKKTLIQQGYSKKEVDQLIATYAAIPPVKTTKWDTPGLLDALEKAKEYKHALTTIPKSVSSHVSLSGANRLIYNLPNRWGGAYEHAATGLLSEASTYGPVSPGRYMIAEPQTGGEAFIPKRGDYYRSMGILAEAAGWYGARLISGSHGGYAAAGPVSHNTSVSYSIYPRTANFDVNQLSALTREQETALRLGRPG